MNEPSPTLAPCCSLFDHCVTDMIDKPVHLWLKPHNATQLLITDLLLLQRLIKTSTTVTHLFEYYPHLHSASENWSTPAHSCLTVELSALSASKPRLAGCRLKTLTTTIVVIKESNQFY